MTVGNQAFSSPKPLGPAAASLERRIVAGVSGSFLVSVATVPFGYLTSLILARVSSAAVGTYSILGIYLGVVSGILYFGGGTVTIRFLPELAREQKSSFLGSYFLLALGVVAVVSAAFSIFPQAMKFLFGREIDVHTSLLLLWLSPLPLIFFSSLAALKGAMKVTLAQALMRATTVGACLIYGYFLLVHARHFREAPGQVIFVSHFVLMLSVSGIALYGLRTEITFGGKPLQWFLPAGFWGYTLGVQGASMLGLLHMKIDQILVLRRLDVSQLGIFFVALQISEITALLSQFFVEGVLPGITNLMAAHRMERIQDFYYGVGRHMLLLMTSVTIFLLAFGQPILSIFGKQYVNAYAVLLLLVVVHGLDSLTWLNATLMSGVGQPNYWIATQIVRIGFFVALFGWLTNRYGLLGVAVTRGIAWLLAEAFSFYVVLKRLGLRLRIPRQFPLSAGIILCLGAMQFWGRVNSLWLSPVLFLASFALLFGFGGYHLRDLTLKMDLLPAKAPVSRQRQA